MNRLAPLIGLLLFTLGVTAAAPFIGGEPIGPGALWGAADPGAVDILWQLRIPRVVVALLAGAGLAVSGMAFQAMFRNPLATPFTLGTSSGAALGATLCIHLGWQFNLLGVSAVTACALSGAVLSIVLVYGLSRAREGFSTASMLLAGVAVSFFFSSLILLLQYLSDFTRTFRMIRWVMGGLDRVVGYDDPLSILPFVASAALVIFYLTRELNLITTGEELAAGRGVAVHRTKMLLFFAASLAVGGVVAVCGPIGFVGLMAPHICRLLVGADHRVLAPAALLFGGGFLVACDTVARTVIAPTELPVGIITALLGGPFFLWLLLSNRRLA
ncbi:MAG: iron ABC transporter permease [Thermoguttaceae bacterium]|jgi:iron complex transport system permease protein|nr:iron ABC transporter permease [Thermoguttaceae bacterium]